MKDCIFCKIAKGEIPCEKIYRDDFVLSFLDINPVNPGHLLIVTREHYETMADVPDEIIAKVFVKSKQLMKTLKKAMKADYVAVSVVGVDVPHFHIHLIPRYFDDGMAAFWPTKKYAENQAKETAEKIRNEINSK